MQKKIFLALVSFFLGLLLFRYYPQIYFYGVMFILLIVLFFSWSPQRFQTKKEYHNKDNIKIIGIVSVGYIFSGLILMFLK